MLTSRRGGPNKSQGIPRGIFDERSVFLQTVLMPPMSRIYLTPPVT